MSEPMPYDVDVPEGEEIDQSPDWVPPEGEPDLE